MKPVSTSPLPPLERAGLPVGLMKASPSGEKVMVGAPFNTRPTPCFFSEPASQIEPVPVHVLRAHPREAAELARMGCEDRPPLPFLEQVRMALEGAYPVRVYHEGRIELPVESPDEGHRLRRPAETRTHDDHVLVRGKVPDCIKG